MLNYYYYDVYGSLKKNFIEYFTTDKELNEKQTKFKVALEEIKKILDDNNITFFLYCGTALGAHREKKFIEHDKDIDLGLLEDNFYKIKNIMSIIKEKFSIVHSFPKNIDINSDFNNCTEVKIKYIYNGVTIDLFKVSKKKNYYVSYSYTNICNYKPKKRCEFNNKFDFEEIEFFNKRYLIPNKDFLISHYGEDWNIVKKYDYNEGLNKGFYKSLQ
jgi:phosphorylcholine metabolism protein LicD